MPKLVIHSGTSQAREFELRAGTNYFGRSAANDFTIDDPSVSSNHVQITVDGNSIFIKDLGSTNGTFINHSQIKEGVLQPGQFLRLGGVYLVLAADSSALITVPGEAPAVIPSAAAPKVARVTIAGSASAPAGTGLRIGRSDAPTVAVRPPMSESPQTHPAPMTALRAQAPAAVSEMVEPPAGKTACKFHPKAAGNWLCQKCNELYCSVCVSTKKTSEGTSSSCRKCGTVCVPVKVKFVAAKEKQIKVYSDGVILLRTLGFGFAAALLSAAIWTGISRLMGLDVPFLFCPMVAVICGYAVKFASQDRPGAMFSIIAVVFYIIGSVLGKVGMIAATHLTINTGTSLFTSALGFLISIFIAWKIGGGDS